MLPCWEVFVGVEGGVVGYQRLPKRPSGSMGCHIPDNHGGYMLVLSEVSVQSPISFGGGFSFSARLTLDLNRSPLLAIAVEATIAFLSCWAVSKFGLWVREVQNAPRQTVGIVLVAFGQEEGYFQSVFR